MNPKRPAAQYNIGLQFGNTINQTLVFNCNPVYSKTKPTKQVRKIKTFTVCKLITNLLTCVTIL